MSKFTRNKRKREEKIEAEKHKLDINYIERKKFFKKIENIKTCDPYGALLDATGFLCEYLGDSQITKFMKEKFDI